MTWQKLGIEFWDECAHVGLSDAAVRTHAEAIGYLYRVESQDLRIPMTIVRRFAGSPDYEAGIKELCEVGFWRPLPGGWEVVHHAEVIRASLQSQLKHRADERERQRRKRSAAKHQSVGPNVGATQTDRHTDKQLEEGHSSEAANASDDVFYARPTDDLSTQILDLARATPPPLETAAVVAKFGPGARQDLARLVESDQLVPLGRGQYALPDAVPRVQASQPRPWPAHEVGPCTRCGEPCHRYGAGASPLCIKCRGTA